MHKIELTETVKEAQAAMSRGDFGHAEVSLIKALEMQPEDPTLLFFMGSCMMQRGNVPACIAILEKVVAQIPDFAECYGNLGTAYRRAHDVGKAREYMLKCLDLQPNQHEILANLAASHVNEGDPAPGEEYCRQALKIQPGYRKAAWNMSLCLLEQGKWEEGFDEYAKAVKFKQRLSRTYWETHKGQTPILENLEDLKPWETVVLYGEQGLGDEVMFTSITQEFLDYRKGQMEAEGLPVGDLKVIIESHSAMESLYKRTFPDCEVHGSRNQDICTWPLDRDIHWSCAVGNLGKFFRATNASFAKHKGYMKVNEQESATYRKMLEFQADGKPIVGLSWTGGLYKTHRDYRSITLSSLMPLLRQNACFVSLQHENDEEEVDTLRQEMGINIIRMPEAAHAKNIDKVFSLLNAVDLHITVCNSTHHFAGSIGKECWCLVPCNPAWRYAPLDWDHSIWYPNTSKYIRQSRENYPHWHQVVETAAKKLEDWIHGLA